MFFSFKNRQFCFIVLAFLVFSFIFSSGISLVQAEDAGVPAVLSYQGRLTDIDGNLLGGTGTPYFFKFSFWDSPVVGEGNRVWPLAGPNAVSLTVKQGVFNVNIGDTDSSYPDVLNYNFGTNKKIYLQVEASANNSSFETLSPRQLITSSAFAQTAGGLNAEYATSTNLFSTSLNSLNAVFENSTSTNLFTSNFYLGSLDGLLFGTAGAISSMSTSSLLSNLSVNNFATSSVSQWLNDSGYLTSFTETDPIFMSASTSLPYQPLGNYLTSYTETDPFYTASSWSTTTNNSADWNTAYSWGNHAGLYDLLGTATTTASSTANSVLNDWLALNPTSGTNTGDETQTTIKNKLGSSASTTDGYLTANDWIIFNAKQPAGNYLTSFTETDPIFMSASTSLPYQPLGNYLTDNQNITLSGAITGSGTTSITTTLTGVGLDNVFASASGFLKKTGTATYSLDTNTYLTSLSGAFLLDQTTPQSIINGQPIFTQGLKITAGQDIRPSADSTTAINIAQADGTDFVTFDTTNKRVGIGTTAPSGVIHAVNSAFASTALFERSGQTSDSAVTSMRLLATKTTDMGNGFGVGFGLNIQDDAGVINQIGLIGAVRNGADNSGDIYFTSYAAGAGTERMRITSAGNVGIGTTAPTGVIHAADSSVTNIALFERSGQTTNSVFGAARTLATKTTDMADGFGAGQLFNIQDDAAVINTIGLIGAVRAGADSTGDLVFRPATSGTTNERMRITSAGKVGIGTTAPAHPFQVVGGATGAETILASIRSNFITNNTASTLRFINSTIDATTAASEISSIRTNATYSGDTDFIFRTGYASAITERMRITSVGNVGIGTTAPGAKLEVVDAAANPGFKFTTSEIANNWMKLFPYQLQMNRADASNAGLDFITTNSGSWGASGGYISFRPNNVEKMRVNVAGNVGIGITAPLTALHVVKADEVPIYADSYSDTNYAAGVVGRRARGSVASPTAVQSGDFLNGVFGRGYNSSAFTSSSNGLVGITAAETWTAGANGTNIVFETTANAGTTRTEKMRITDAGNVGIGTSTPSQALTVVGNARFTAVGSGSYSTDLNLTADGTLTTSASDIALKINLLSLDTDTGTSSTAVLDKVLGLKPYSFNWKSDPNGKRDIGLVAQDVENIFPEITFTNKVDGYKGINYSRLPVILVSAIQELNAKIVRVGSYVVDGVANFAEVIVNKLTAKEIKSDKICLGETCIDEAMLKELIEKNSLTATSTATTTAPNSSLINEGEGTTTATTTLDIIEATSTATTTPETEATSTPPEVTSTEPIATTTEPVITIPEPEISNLDNTPIVEPELTTEQVTATTTEN